jgi:hypothetical protein
VNIAARKQEEMSAWSFEIQKVGLVPWVSWRRLADWGLAAAALRTHQYPAVDATVLVFAIGYPGVLVPMYREVPGCPPGGEFYSEIPGRALGMIQIELAYGLGPKAQLPCSSPAGALVSLERRM